MRSDDPALADVIAALPQAERPPLLSTDVTLVPGGVRTQGGATTIDRLYWGNTLTVAVRGQDELLAALARLLSGYALPPQPGTLLLDAGVVVDTRTSRAALLPTLFRPYLGVRYRAWLRRGLLLLPQPVVRVDPHECAFVVDPVHPDVAALGDVPWPGDLRPGDRVPLAAAVRVSVGEPGAASAADLLQSLWQSVRPLRWWTHEDMAPVADALAALVQRLPSRRQVPTYDDLTDLVPGLFADGA